MRLAGLIRLSVCAVLAVVTFGLPAAETDYPNVVIPEGVDFSEDGRRALAEGRVIMLLVSQEHCPYCVQIKEQILHPMILAGDYQDQLLMREIFIDLDRSAIDFKGIEREVRDLAMQYGADITPTLLFLDSEGKELAERMVGINTPEMYFYYVDESIKQALEVMQ